MDWPRGCARHARSALHSARDVKSGCAGRAPAATSRRARRSAAGAAVRRQARRPVTGAVPDAIALARATLATIRRNLVWAFGYNTAAIPLAAAGYLNPLIAGAAMAASSAFVVASSARLRGFGPAGTGLTPAAESGPREEVASCRGSPGTCASLRLGDSPACHKTAGYG
jgi:hypothetical protein